MSAESRAVLFDLDDTLYSERRFALSGFREVARVIAGPSRREEAWIFGVLQRELRRGGRASIFQKLCVELGASTDAIPALVDVMRGHLPSLRLPASSERVLEALRPAWKLGIVTNGYPDVQRRKVLALGLHRRVDSIVYASEHGSGAGKPDREPFLAAAAALGVAPDRCVFIGNDPLCDIAGARRVGMRTIWVARQGRSHEHIVCAADAMVSRVDEAAPLVGRLVKEARTQCA